MGGIEGREGPSGHCTKVEAGYSGHGDKEPPGWLVLAVWDANYSQAGFLLTKEISSTIRIAPAEPLEVAQNFRSDLLLNGVGYPMV